MDLTSQSPVESEGKGAILERKGEEMETEMEQPPPPAYVSMVDPFLVEALQNPRHRLTS